MKKFLKKILVSVILVIILHISVAFLADGYTDPFYIRFTTPKQSSLILGTSRPAQGLQPAVIDSVLNLQGSSNKLFNFAFTVEHSPYGRVYYEAIRKKLNPDTRHGIFILAVDPWSVSSGTDDPNDENLFRENSLALNTTSYYNISPNFDYLYHNYKAGWGTLILNKLRKQPSGMLLHEDGWLEVTIPMTNAAVAKRIHAKIRFYRENLLIKYKFSSKRLSFLNKTIQLLKNHGEVYLVRLPVHPEMIKIENEFLSNFDGLMQELSEHADVPYYNFISDSDKYLFTDGNHLYKNSGKQISMILSDLIKKDKEARLASSNPVN